MTIGASSLFEANGARPLGDAADWITGTMLGSVAVTLCVLAVAFVGFALVSGRMEIRGSIRVVLGCFTLLGAQTIASAFMTVAEPQGRTIQFLPADPIAMDPRGDLPPANYDPYAGASLRRD